jgi:choline-sulfatase
VARSGSSSRPALSPGPLIDPADVQRTIDLYDAEIRAADRELERLFLALDRLGQTAHTLLALTSDHGEEFGGPDLHGHHFKEHLLRVPLLLHWPGRIAPRRIARPVSTVDLAITLHELLALGGAQPGGHSLVPWLNGAAATDPPSPLIAETLVRGPEGRSLRSGMWKIHQVGASSRLYQLDLDPGEYYDLAEREPERLRRMLSLLEDWRAGLRARAAAPAIPIQTSNEQVERLRALGYLR